VLQVEDFHIAEKKEDIGYYVGALGKRKGQTDSVFRYLCLSRLCDGTSSACRTLADLVGRCPYSVTSTTLTLLLWGWNDLQDQRS